MEYRGQRVTIMGLGHFGGATAAARWLARQGAVVTVTDLADAQTLAPSLAELDGVPITAFHLGGHQENDFRGADLVVVNPAVRPGNPLVRLARESGARLTTEIELFIDACPAPIVGVTGSNGKSTTAAMTAAILRASGFSTWLGGNIGGSLLDPLDRITAADRVVLELSSFQLWHLGATTTMPHVAVVTGCSPNHLDWHPSFSDYVAAKQRILTGQGPDDVAVLNTFDAEVGAWQAIVRGRLARPLPLEDIPTLLVPGLHNRIDAACAAAAALAAGARPEAVGPGLRSFRGLPQRLERFALIDGRSFYNDSTATTPESTRAALESLDGPIWLLAGGRDKGFDFSEMLAAVARRARGAAFFGSVGPALRDSLPASVLPKGTVPFSSDENRDSPPLLPTRVPCTATGTMDEALQWCWNRSRPGDVIVLSPGCSSHDQFGNFRERGERFVAMVATLARSYNIGATS